jgi:hypothetical protein
MAALESRLRRTGEVTNRESRDKLSESKSPRQIGMPLPQLIPGHSDGTRSIVF